MYYYKFVKVVYENIVYKIFSNEKL
jgi:hypothetical protein